jgi:hypothetical protein
VTVNLKAPSPALVVACIALLFALGPAVKAANTVFSTDIVDGEVKTVDIANGAITAAKLAPNAVRSVNILANSITAANIRGADVKGPINIPAGYVPNGRCRQLDLSIQGAAIGEVVILSVRGPVQDGVHLHALGVLVANHVTFTICNHSGTTQAAISNLPVRVLTIG